MKTRTLNLFVYFMLAGVAFLIIQQVQDLPEPLPGEPGSALYPKMISWFIIVLFAVGAVRSIMDGSGGIFEIPQFPRLAGTMAILAAWVLAWQFLGHFYVLEFILLSLLFFWYRWPVGLTMRMAAENLLLALAVTVLCYLVFNKLIYVDL